MSSLSRAMKIGLALTASGCSVITTFDGLTGPSDAQDDAGADAAMHDASVDAFTNDDANANANDATPIDGATSSEAAATDGTAPLTYPSVVLADSPSLYWRFEGTSTITDSSGNGHTGTILGTATLGATGIAGSGALSFNQGAVSGGNILAFAGNAAFSLEVWVNQEADSGVYSLVCRELDPADGYCLFTVTGTPYIERENSTNDDTAQGLSAMTPNTYTHLVATYDGSSKITLYVNGTEVAQATSTIALPGAASVPFLAGDNDDGSNGRFVGLLDEVAVYDHALTASRILLHYQVGIGAN